MADQRIRELLRELERMGVRLVERPSDELIAWLQEGARAAALPARERGTDLVSGLCAWLAAMGSPVPCDAARTQPSAEFGTRLYRRHACTLPLGHEGDHERHTAKRVLRWPQEQDERLVLANPPPRPAGPRERGCGLPHLGIPHLRCAQPRGHEGSHWLYVRSG